MAQIIKIAGGIILAVAVLYGFISWRNYSEKQALTAACLRHDRNARYNGNLVILEDWYLFLQADVESGARRPDGSWVSR